MDNNLNIHSQEFTHSQIVLTKLLALFICLLLSSSIFANNISSKQQLEFTIANIGKTLSSVQQSNMFKIGYSSTKDRQNRGLGLAIVKKTVINHDGYIEFVPYSEGVALTISIPIKKVHYV
jgi:signal transduction histidine kinase